jgi:uncharacterized membrane protein
MTATGFHSTDTAPPGRILAVDLARDGGAAGDGGVPFRLRPRAFRLARAGDLGDGGLAVLALLTAGSFLFLAGVSLWLGHGAGIRWRGFWRRFVKVAGAAAVISAATWVAMGDVFIFFGILHAIAAASLLGLLFLRVPVAGLLALAALAFAAPSFARAEVFDPWWMWWTGLADGVGALGRLRAAGTVVRAVPPGPGAGPGWGAGSASGRGWRRGGAGPGPSVWRCRGGIRSGSTWRISRC